MLACSLIVLILCMTLYTYQLHRSWQRAYNSLKELTDILQKRDVYNRWQMAEYQKWLALPLRGIPDIINLPACRAIEVESRKES